MDNCGALNTQAPGDYFYYDGNRVVEYHKTAAQANPPGGGGGGGGGPGTEKHIEGTSEADAEYDDAGYDAAYDEAEYDNPDHDKADYDKDMRGKPLPLSGGELGGGESGRVGLQTHLLPPDQTAQVRVDNINAHRKHDVLPGGDVPLGKDSTVNYSGDYDEQTGDPVVLVLDQEFVYGPQYIDELVAYYADRSSVPNWRYVLQDAAYNVVGYVSHAGSPMQQFAYHPYGRLQAVENGAGTTTNDSELSMLYRTLWLERETACPNATGPCPLTAATLIHNRGRYYEIPFGRYTSRDPNGQTLVLANALAMNAQTQSAFASFSPTGQYSDGMNPYQFVGSNPVNRTDPRGLWSYGELATMVGIQGMLGGFINGFVCKLAGEDFWEGFATGTIGGALGGGAGFAFTAARAGFFGSVVLSGLAQGFVESASSTFYSQGDFSDALVEGLWGSRRWGCHRRTHDRGTKGSHGVPLA